MVHVDKVSKRTDTNIPTMSHKWHLKNFSAEYSLRLAAITVPAEAVVLGKVFLGTVITNDTQLDPLDRDT